MVTFNMVCDKMGGRLVAVVWLVSTLMVIEVASSQWIQDVRLVNGGRPNQGRLEVLLNSSTEWGTVCDDNWGKEDAEVVCRQLGYSGVIRALDNFGQGTGDIWLDEVACIGNETGLEDCKFDNTSDCHHHGDVSVICQLPGYLGCFNHARNSYLFPPSEEKGNEVHALRCIKLCYEEGYVFAGLQFGYFCYCGGHDTMYDSQGRVADSECSNPCNGDSNQICGGDRLVGVFDVRKTLCSDPRTPNSRLEGGDSFIFTSVVNISCQVGFGQIRLQCSQEAGEVKWIPDIPKCPDVTQPDVRLVNGDYPNMGRVEVMAINGEWGTVCDNNWRKPEAEVVCRQLGYNDYIAARSGAFFGEGTGQILLDNVDCTRDETRLNECAFLTVDNCGHDADAGVTCQLPGYLGCFVDSTELRVLPFSKMSGPSVHALQCIIHCFGKGYVFAGVERGNECYCGRSDTAYTRLGEAHRSACRTACSGNSNLHCGGDNAISVFNVTKAHCPDPGVPHGGARTGNSFVFGSTVHFSCEEGFELSGEPTLHCLLARGHTDESGVVGWTSDVPQCVDTDTTSSLDTTTSLGAVIGPLFAVGILLVILITVFFLIRRRKRRIANTHPKPSNNPSPDAVQYANVNEGTPNVYCSVEEPTDNSSSQFTVQQPTVAIVSEQNSNEQHGDIMVDNIIYEGYLGDDDVDVNLQSNETSDSKERENIGELYSQIKR